MTSFNDMSARGKALTVLALITFGLISGWLGYNIGHWLGSN